MDWKAYDEAGSVARCTHCGTKQEIGIATGDEVIMLCPKRRDEDHPTPTLEEIVKEDDVLLQNLQELANDINEAVETFKDEE